MKLLGISNTKTMKGEALGYRTYIMHLAPSTLSGHQVCPMASLGCSTACLNLSGMGRFSTVQAARVAKTKRFFQDRVAFMQQLVKEVRAAVKSSQKLGLTPVFRLNGTSDLSWEKYDMLPGLMYLSASLLYSSMTTPRCWDVRPKALPTTT